MKYTGGWNDGPGERGHGLSWGWDQGLGEERRHREVQGPSLLSAAWEMR